MKRYAAANIIKLNVPKQTVRKLTLPSPMGHAAHAKKMATRMERKIIMINTHSLKKLDIFLPFSCTPYLGVRGVFYFEIPRLPLRHILDPLVDLPHAE
jgi:hypothetical protein